MIVLSAKPKIGIIHKQPHLFSKMNTFCIFVFRFVFYLELLGILVFFFLDLKF